MERYSKMEMLVLALGLTVGLFIREWRRGEMITQIIHERDFLHSENAALRIRIAELEATQEWHPASEPPEDNENGFSKGREVQYVDGTVDTVPYYHSMKRWWKNHPHIIRWRDLPPMPVKP